MVLQRAWHRTDGTCGEDKRCRRTFQKPVRHNPHNPPLRLAVRTGARRLGPLAASRRVSGRIMGITAAPNWWGQRLHHAMAWPMPWNLAPGRSPKPAVPRRAVGRGRSRHTARGGHDIPSAVNSPDHRQGHDLTIGLHPGVLVERVLTHRRLPDRSLPWADPVALMSLRSPLVGGPFRAENGGWLSADVVGP
jgi:hypothetical protein